MALKLKDFFIWQTFKEYSHCMDIPTDKRSRRRLSLHPVRNDAPLLGSGVRFRDNSGWV
jgi:hypothetical protein